MNRLQIASTRWPNSQTFVWWAIGAETASHHKNVGKISPANGTGFFLTFILNEGTDRGSVFTRQSELPMYNKLPSPLACFEALSKCTPRTPPYSPRAIIFNIFP